jgi:hypothetical protein
LDLVVTKCLTKNLLENRNNGVTLNLLSIFVDGFMVPTKSFSIFYVPEHILKMPEKGQIGTLVS